MEYFLAYIHKQPLAYSLIIIGFVSFLESLAFVGLVLPGIILMSALGTLIGTGKLTLYSACIAGSIGCLLGDWISYYFGWKCKKWLHNLYFFKKYQKIFIMTKKALYNYSFLTVLIGRFFGPTRPIIPMLSGMLKLPFKKFILPNFIGCIFWPFLYFLPGIITGIAINNPVFKEKNDYFKYIFSIILLINWISIWLFWKWWQVKKYKKKYFSLSSKKLFRISLITFLIGITGIILIQFHPKMFIFRKLFWKIFYIS
ncbi:DedA family protein [Buchnera aphidicola (Kurisakia onigurumii)]|uniref:DedA family protein n=1 Tax=Buchnera aphidicola TaxID=9 RepID=UPI0031B6EE83